MDRTDPHIEAYADQLSVAPGEALHLHTSTSASRYRVEIARHGRHREVVWRRDGIVGGEHPVPDDASTHGCGWPAELKVETSADWRSGYYGVVLNGEDQPCRSEAAFVVRSGRPGHDTGILIQLTTNTSNAYNTYGGANLYRGRDGPAGRVSFNRPEARLPGIDGIYFFSLDERVRTDLESGSPSNRFIEEFHEQAESKGISGIGLTPHATITATVPDNEWIMQDPFGAGPIEYHMKSRAGRIDVYNATSAGEDGWTHWQHPFTAWAESEGYAIDFAVNSDLEFHPEILESYRLVLSVGHDEYWSAPMRDSLEAFIGNGGNVAFFSGNNLFWQVRSEENGRALVCWKEVEIDPLYPDGDLSKLSTNWCHRLIGRPENTLTGVSFAFGGYTRFFDQFRDASGGYKVHRPDHWMFADTGVTRGDQIGAADQIVQYEADGCELEWRYGLPHPTGRDGTPESFEIAATAPAGLSDFDGSVEMVSAAIYGDSGRQIQSSGHAVMGTYTRGGTVFTCGCTHWAFGLRGRNPVVEQITRNILDRLGPSGRN